MKADLPYRLEKGKLVDVPEVEARWKNVMPLNMLASHLADLKKATAIGIDYGFEDQFTHIQMTVPKLSARLMEARIPVQASGYHGDHNEGVPDRVRTSVIPFIAEHLSFEGQPTKKDQ